MKAEASTAWSTRPVLLDPIGSPLLVQRKRIQIYARHLKLPCSQVYAQPNSCGCNSWMVVRRCTHLMVLRLAKSTNSDSWERTVFCFSLCVQGKATQVAQKNRAPFPKPLDCNPRMRFCYQFAWATLVLLTYMNTVIPRLEGKKALRGGFMTASISLWHRDTDYMEDATWRCAHCDGINKLIFLVFGIMSLRRLTWKEFTTTQRKEFVVHIFWLVP